LRTFACSTIISWSSPAVLKALTLMACLRDLLLALRYPSS
jgi:hypothetical protein